MFVQCMLCNPLPAQSTYGLYPVEYIQQEIVGEVFTIIGTCRPEKEKERESVRYTYVHRLRLGLGLELGCMYI